MNETGHTEPRRLGLLRRFVTLSFRFWRGPTKKIAWILALSFLGALTVNMLLSIAVNRWNKYFFDALQNKDIEALTWSIALVAGLALASAIAMVALTQARMRLQLRWREWLTKTLVARWLSDRRFYKLSILRTVDNPEARMAEDGRLSIELFVDLAGGVLNTLMLSFAFVFVLWQVGGSITVGGVTIPGYLVIAVVIYTSLTTFGMYKLGRPLVARVEEKAAGEGDFRYSLTRTRENAETIALIGGEEDEQRMLADNFAELARRWILVIGRQVRMIFLSSGNNVIAPAVPLLLGAPKFLSGEMTLGDLMQAAAAFSSVQTALNWLADNALSLANWSASARRVAALEKAFEEMDRLSGKQDANSIQIKDSDDKSVHLISLSIAQHDGKIMLDESDARIEMGEKVIVKGESGSGKSTLIRAIAGLWPWGSGQILRPLDARFSFMPQRPYIPLGTLRTVLSYPEDGVSFTDEEIAEILEECGLQHFIERLDEENNWSSILSGGEQQRLAFARVFLKKPDIIIMDESTSALDEISQRRMMEMMTDRLPEAMVIHVAHRPGLDKYHTREIVLKREGGGPAVVREGETLKLRIGGLAISSLLKRLARRDRKTEPDLVIEVEDDGTKPDRSAP
jgi:putative ATP-binding cassette transporter